MTEQTTEMAQRPIWIKSGTPCPHPIANYSCVPCAECLTREAGGGLVRQGIPNKASLGPRNPLPAREVRNV